MNKVIFISLILSFLFTSCTDSVKAEGDAGLAQDFKVETFDAISADGSFKLILIPNDSSYVSVQTHRNLIENMNIYVQNKTLHIAENKPVENFESYVIYLYYHQDLKEISIADKILLESATSLNFDNFQLKTSDASMVEQFSINAKEAEITALDKSEIILTGQASTLKLKAKAYAKLDLNDLDISVLEVDLAGDAHVKAKIDKKLSGRILQNSTLTYMGNPVKDVEVKENGEILKQ